MTQEPAQGAERAPVRRQVRRSPRLSVFLGTGAVVGVLVAALLTVTLARPDGRDGVDYGLGAVFGYLAVGLGIVGLLLAGALALLLGRIVRR